MDLNVVQIAPCLSFPELALRWLWTEGDGCDMVSHASLSAALIFHALHRENAINDLGRCVVVSHASLSAAHIFHVLHLENAINDLGSCVVVSHVCVSGVLAHPFMSLVEYSTTCLIPEYI